MTKTFKFIIFLLAMVLTSPALAIPKHVVDEFATKLKNRIVQPLEISVKPYAELYKKGDRSEPVTVFFIVGYTRDSHDSGWSYNFSYISELEEWMQYRHIRFTEIRFNGKRIEDSCNNKEFSILVPMSGYRTSGITFSFTSFRVEDLQFVSPPYLRSETGKFDIPVTDKYDAVCLEGPCPWINPEVTKSKPEIKPEVQDPKIEIRPILNKESKPIPEEVILDPIRSVNERNLTLFERSNKLRSIFRQIPNKPITNWYDWVQTNLGPKPTKTTE